MAQNDPDNRNNIIKLNGWLRIAPNQYTVCEYASGIYEPALVDNLAARLRYYAKRGLRGIVFSYGAPSNFPRLWQYLLDELLWDPHQDEHKLARRFIERYYGNASKPIAEFFRLSHERYEETLKRGEKLKKLRPPGYYTPEFVKQATACFAKAIELVKTRKDEKLLAEVKKEESLFVLDSMKHPASRELTPVAEATLKWQLDLLARLAGDSDKAKTGLAQTVYKIGLEIDSYQKGAMPVVRKWLAEQNFPRPKVFVKIKGGVRIPAQAFMYAGYGPRMFKVGDGYVVEPKIAVAIYVKGNSFHLSHRMEAEFELDELPGDGSAVLDVQGQDCDHPVDAAEIRVEVNGRSIYEGQVVVVKRMWSRQSFEIPAGLLKKGRNKLTFVNVGDPKSIKKWHDRWFMLADAVIRFKVGK